MIITSVDYDRSTSDSRSPSPDWIKQGLTSHSTHFRSFRRRWGDCGISQDCSQSEPTVCAVLSSVCATTVDNSGVYHSHTLCMCIIWKASCPYVTVTGTRSGECLHSEAPVKSNATYYHASLNRNKKCSADRGGGWVARVNAALTSYEDVHYVIENAASQCIVVYTVTPATPTRECQW